MRILGILASIAVLTSSLSAQVPSYVPTNGLVGWWPFNGNANDESGTGNNGTVNGATLATDRFGNANAAYFFPGDVNNKIVVNYSSTLDFNPEYSVSLWAKFDAPWSFHQEDLVYKTPANWSCLEGWAVWMDRGVGNDPYLLGAHHGSSGNSCLVSQDTVGDYTEINQWMHILAVYQNGHLDLYLNGQYVSTSGQIALINSQSDLVFGGSKNPVSGAYDRNIDDIGVWNRALTPAEIQALFSAALPPPCVSPDPVSFTGLGSSYTLADAPVTLVGTPVGGVFIGPGVSGNNFDPAAAGVGTHSIQYVYVDGNNCLNAAGQCTEVTLNVGSGGNQMGTDGVRVFPNPNRGQFTVELDLTGLVGLQVFDTRGALVHNEVFTASGARTQRSLDLSSLAQGNYTLQVQHEGQRITQTVVVE